MRLTRGRDRGGGRTGGRTRRCTPDKQKTEIYLTSQHAEHVGRYVSVSEMRRRCTGIAPSNSVFSPLPSLHCLCGRKCGSKLTSPQRLPPVQLVLKPNVHQIKHAASRCGLCGNNSHRKENIPAVAFHTPKASPLKPSSTSTPQQLAPISHLVAATLPTPYASRMHLSSAALLVSCPLLPTLGRGHPTSLNPLV